MLENTPDGPKAVTAQWLTQVLRSQNVISQTVVESIQVGSIQGQAGGNGQIARFSLDYCQLEERAPISLIGKFSAADPAIRTLINEAGLYEREVRFYELLGTQNVAIPHCYYSSINIDTGASVLLLEDLSHLRAANIVVGAERADAEKVIEFLAALHAKWWDSPQLETMSWLPSFNQNVKLLKGLYKWEKFLQQVESCLPDFRLSESFHEVGRSFDQYLDTFCEQLTRSPLTCIHSDAHLDNLLFGLSANDPPVMMIDWQVVAQGRGVIDVAYFLIRSIPYEQRQQTEHSLLQIYHKLLIQNGIHDYDFDQCWTEYQHAFFWPFLVVVGSASAGDKTFVQNPARFKVTLERLTAFIEHHTVEILLSK